MDDTQAKKDRELLDKVHRLCGDADLEDVCTDGDLPIPTLDEIVAAAKRERTRDIIRCLERIHDKKVDSFVLGNKDAEALEFLRKFLPILSHGIEEEFLSIQE